MDPAALGMFYPVVAVLAFIGTIIGAFVTFDRWQGKKMDARIAEAFTGRAEADIHRYASLADTLKDSFRDSLADHAKDEAGRLDAIRDRITEFHVKVEIAVQDTKRIALHVSSEYQGLKATIGELSRRIEILENEVKGLRGRL